MQLKIGDQCIAIERAGELTYISHAHRDHIARGKKFLVSRATACLLALKHEQIVEKTKDVEMHPAGHILGSTQIRAHTNEGLLVYTSDFKLRDGFTTKGCEILECDVLYIDGTFFDPAFVFPEKDEIAEQIVKWVRTTTKEKCAVIGAYKIGKAQETIKLLNEHGIEPFATKEIAHYCEIYKRHGINLHYHYKDVEESGKGDVIITSYHAAQQRYFPKDFEVALVTGWATKYKFQVQAFPLSDHASYCEIVDYIEESGAKKVVFLRKV